MENRRRHFRHSFPSAHCLDVILTNNKSSVSVAGVITNLSIGGLCVETTDDRISTSERWTAAFALDAENVTIGIERVYAQHEAHVCYGFRFLPPTNLNARDSLEKSVWKFLLEQQRAQRRQIQEAARVAG